MWANPLLAPSAETGATGAIAWQALNTQFFHESEALTLLLRVTRCYDLCRPEMRMAISIACS